MKFGRPIALLARASRWMNALAGFALLLMMGHIVADVAMKFLFNRPIPGTPETVAFYYMVAAVFLPLAYVELRGEHIAVDLLYDRMPRPVRRLFMGIAHLFSIGFFAALGYQSWLDAANALRVGEITMGAVALPIWPSRFFLPIGFAAIALVSLVRLVNEVVLGRMIETETKQTV